MTGRGCALLTYMREHKADTATEKTKREIVTRLSSVLCSYGIAFNVKPFQGKGRVGSASKNKSRSIPAPNHL